MPAMPIQPNSATGLSGTVTAPDAPREQPVSNAAAAGSALSAAAAAVPSQQATDGLFSPVTPTSMRLYLMRVPLRDLSSAYDEVKQMLPPEDQVRQPAGSRVPPVQGEDRSGRAVDDAMRAAAQGPDATARGQAASAAAPSGTASADSASGRSRTDALTAEVKAQDQPRPPEQQMKSPRADLPMPQDPVPGGISPFAPAPPPAQQVNLKA